MIPLFDNADKIRVTTSAAITVDVVCGYADALQVPAPPVVQAFGRTLNAITTATTTDVLVGSSTANIVRKLESLHARNKHASSSVDVTIFYEDSGTAYELYKATLKAGESIEYNEEYGFFKITTVASSLDELMRSLDADATGTNGTGAQQWFPSNGAVSVEASSLYHFRGEIRITRAAGTTSHTTSLLFGGSAGISSLDGVVYVGTGDVDTNIALNRTVFASASAVVVKAASTSATEVITMAVEGSLRTTTAGTFIPQFQYSAAPGGAPTIKRNSHFEMERVGPSSLTAIGTWT